MYGANITSDKTNATAEAGNMFNFEYSSDNVDIATPIKVLFKTGAKKVKYRTDVNTIGSTVKIELYVGPTTSANGTEISPVNYNPAIGASAPLIKIYHTPTVSNNGTLAYTRYFLGYAQGNSRQGASRSDSIWRWLAPNTTYLAILTPAADNTQVSYGGDFSEE